MAEAGAVIGNLGGAGCGFWGRGRTPGLIKRTGSRLIMDAGIGNEELANRPASETGALFGVSMKSVPLANVEPDGKGRLLHYPVGERYNYIYRAPAGVTWEPQGQFLHFGDPRGLTYPVCFPQIISVLASEHATPSCAQSAHQVTQYSRVLEECHRDLCMRRKPNRRAPPNAGIAPRLTIEHRWPGVGEPRRSA